MTDMGLPLFDYTPPQDAVVLQAFAPRKYLGRRPGDGKGRPVLPGQSLVLGHGNRAFIHLGAGVWAVIDALDFPKIAGVTWGACRKKNGIYAARRKTKDADGPSVIYLHRVLVAVKPGLFVDHKDGNRLNNQRVNLRICTQAENNKNMPILRSNTSGFKGVSFRKDRGKFSAKIRDDKGLQRSLGCFDTAEDAHAAYRKAAVKFHGQFARFK